MGQVQLDQFGASSKKGEGEGKNEGRWKRFETFQSRLDACGTANATPARPDLEFGSVGKLLFIEAKISSF